MSTKRCLSASFFLLIYVLISSPTVHAQEEVPDAVLAILEDNCAFAGCHTGPNSPRDLDLSEGFILSSVVNVPSKDRPEYLRVKPGDPTNSYLIMKLQGGPNIVGDRMPRGSDPLPPDQVATLESWIRSMQPTQQQVEAPQREYAQAFPGVSLATLPSTQTLDPGLFYFRIAHRWRGSVGEGFDQLFGLDFGALVFIDFGFALNENLLLEVGRFGNNATFEFALKWRFLREKTDGSVPISAGIRAGVDWETTEQLADPDNPGDFLKRTDSQRFHWFVQAPISKALGKRFSILFTPAVLLNPSVNVSGEDPMITLGVGGKVLLMEDFWLFVEGVPIVSGSEEANVLGVIGVDESGKEVFYDAWTVGFERRVGGHVFHVYATNSLGLSTNAYMSGGDLDFDVLDGNLRFGFNVYRNLRLPF